MGTNDSRTARNREASVARTARLQTTLRCVTPRGQLLPEATARPRACRDVWGGASEAGTCGRWGRSRALLGWVGARTHQLHADGADDRVDAQHLDDGARRRLQQRRHVAHAGDARRLLDGPLLGPARRRRANTRARTGWCAGLAAAGDRSPPPRHWGRSCSRAEARPPRKGCKGAGGEADGAGGEQVATAAHRTRWPATPSHPKARLPRAHLLRAVCVSSTGSTCAPRLPATVVLSSACSTLRTARAQRGHSTGTARAQRHQVAARTAHTPRAIAPPRAAKAAAAERTGIGSSCGWVRRGPFTAPVLQHEGAPELAQQLPELGRHLEVGAVVQEHHLVRRAAAAPQPRPDAAAPCERCLRAPATHTRLRVRRDAVGRWEAARRWVWTLWLAAPLTCGPHHKVACARFRRAAGRGARRRVGWPRKQRTLGPHARTQTWRGPSSCWAAAAPAKRVRVGAPHRTHLRAGPRA